MSAAPTVGERCGTYAEYQAHRHRGEEPCDDCRRASAEYMRRYRSDEANRSREQALAFARERAVWRLAKMYPAAYHALVAEESADIPELPRMVAECHPGRPHKAKGLCSSCYDRSRRERAR